MEVKALITGAFLTGLFAISMNSLAQEQQRKEGNGKPENANEYMHRTPVDQLIQRFESPGRDAYQQPEKVLRYLGDIKGKKIMDIGAGSGYFSIKLAKAGAEVIAADVDDEFQDYLKKRIEKEAFQELDIELRKIPFDDPGLKEQEVDMVFMTNVYHHIEDRPEYFAKVLKGISQDGALVIVDFFKTELPVGPPPDHKVSIDEVVSELKAAGFRDIEVEVDLLPYQFIVKAF